MTDSEQTRVKGEAVERLSRLREDRACFAVQAGAFHRYLEGVLKVLANLRNQGKGTPGDKWPDKWPEREGWPTSDRLWDLFQSARENREEIKDLVERFHEWGIPVNR